MLPAVLGEVIYKKCEAVTIGRRKIRSEQYKRQKW